MNIRILRSRSRSLLSSMPSWGGAAVARGLVLSLMTASLLTFVVVAAPKAKAADACAAPTNPILCENSKPGTPEEIWDVPGAGDSSIQGFATDMSVNVGTTESFKVDTSAPYTIDIYRLGYYGGDGARFITSVTPTARNQPACFTDQTTHLIDCGTWAVSGSWAVPSSAVSGMYIAKITRTDSEGGASQIPFVVRNDASTSGIVFQSSDTTWQAYNNYGSDSFDGGANFYGGTSYDSNNRAYKLSYNRPFITRGWEGGRDYLFSNEYPMIRFLERSGYDVSYISGIDTSRNGALLKNHKVFLTAGHDEYWDTQQRANVLAARDAGVNLAFFSGNDDYWKTRYENSADGSNTPNRTLVSYKETWSNGKIDPSSLWTGTWRDPRFSPPADGNNPENALGGTLFMSNVTDLPLTVNAIEGKLRIWRNTGLASQSTGQSTALAEHTVGYESNEDLDNGFRPAGLIDMSTVSSSVPAELQDYGTVTASGTTTHHITLYKAPSGALVFSAGTIQWAWGLDDDHDGVESPADTRMQQATVNLLADMGVQPLSLISGLIAAAKSTDTTAPTSVITSPAAGATVANGTAMTATGTATDAGGGVVGGVEVSVDGGSTWHPATGRATWSYDFVAHGSGSVAIKSRATDDSGNIETPSAGKTITENCSCTLFGNSVPATVDSGDPANVELGVKVVPTANGYISGVRFYKAAGNTGTHTGTLWSSTGTQLATGTFSGETASGWQTLTFANPVAVTTGTSYVVSYRAPNGHYSADANFFSPRDWVAGPLKAPRSTQTAGNGVYADGGLFPSSSYQDENYYVDAIFTGSNSTPPSVSAFSPRNLQKGVATNSVVTATFSMPITSGSAQVSVKTSGGATVAGSTGYDAGTQTATFTPTSALAASTTYTVTVSGATSSTGTTMTATSWTFTTDTVATCPCSLFGTTATPTTADSGDGNSVEVGTKFTPSTSGSITGVRFYKATANTGTHIGTLWSSTGTALATGTFSGETASGWQTLTFATPVAVAAGSTYTASYLAPNGHYAADSSFFNTSYSSGALTAPATTNGVYAYGLGGTAPTSTFSTTNYWVDPLFVPGSTPPSVTSTTPASGATGVGIGTTATANFSVPVQSSTVQLTLTGPGTTSVAGTLTTAAQSVTFTPSSALAASTVYTATVSGAQNTSGVAMSPFSWTFTTASAATCPCSLFTATATPSTVDSGDTSAVQLGVRFTPAVDGFISGVKFYKAAANTGTHIGKLWSSTGTVLATGTFTGEPASGWTTLTFPTAVAVTAGTTYTASYLAPNGHYSANANFFGSPYSNGPLVAPATGGNGVYVYGTGSAAPTNSYQASNYWVDVTFVTTSAAPTVSATTPAGSATGVSAAVAPTATFSLPMQSSSIQLTLKSTSDQVTVPGAVTYAADSATATFTPTAALSASTQYTAKVAAATSSSGTAMAAPFSWSFTTAAAASCPCSLFGASSTPSTVDSGESSSLELGLRFTPSRNGTVTGVKFYKAAANTGTHTGSLWSASGTRLATGNFSGETASGWQTLTFATPVAVTAGTTYTASYYAPNGHFSTTPNFFASPVSNGPLTAPSTGGNGKYLYGTGGSIPSNTYQASNYWVDVVFT